MKKYMGLAIALVIACVIAGFAIYYATKSIDGSNEAALKERIEFVLKDSTMGADNLEIEKIVDTANGKYVGFNLGETIGIAEFEKTSSGRYKIITASYVPSRVMQTVSADSKDEKTNYLLLFGDTEDLELKTIEMNSGNMKKAYTLDDNKYYFIVEQLPKLEDGESQNISLKYFDKNGKEIYK